MATHSSFLAWRIPWTEEPVRLRSMGSERVGHNVSTHAYTGFPGALVVKNPADKEGDIRNADSIPASGRSPG